MARNIRVEQTEDYDTFVLLPGNRKVDELHVKRLIKKMSEEGNLTEIFPIIVNERMEVIDGQHRLEALQRLGWPVHYETKKGLTIDTVQALNTGVKNWSWFDYAFSFAERGNEQYERFLTMWDYFGFPFTTILYYARGGNDSRSGKFHGGEFKFEDQNKAFNDLKRFREAVVATGGHRTSKFAQAMYTIMHDPAYDHKRMLDKLKKFGTDMKGYTSKEDYLRALEDVYNHHVREDERVRLF